MGVSTFPCIFHSHVSTYQRPTKLRRHWGGCAMSVWIESLLSPTSVLLWEPDSNYHFFPTHQLHLEDQEVTTRSHFRDSIPRRSRLYHGKYHSHRWMWQKNRSCFETTGKAKRKPFIGHILHSAVNVWLSTKFTSGQTFMGCILKRRQVTS